MPESRTAQEKRQRKPRERGDTVTLSVTLPLKTLVEVTAFAEKGDLSRSEAVDKLTRLGLAVFAPEPEAEKVPPVSSCPECLHRAGEVSAIGCLCQSPRCTHPAVPTPAVFLPPRAVEPIQFCPDCGHKTGEAPNLCGCSSPLCVHGNHPPSPPSSEGGEG